MVQVSSNQNNTSRIGRKNPKETARAPNDWNEYNQEPFKNDKKRLLTDTSTSEELVKAFIDCYGYKNTVW